MLKPRLREILSINLKEYLLGNSAAIVTYPGINKTIGIPNIIFITVFSKIIANMYDVMAHNNAIKRSGYFFIVSHFNIYVFYFLDRISLFKFSYYIYGTRYHNSQKYFFEFTVRII